MNTHSHISSLYFRHTRISHGRLQEAGSNNFTEYPGFLVRSEPYETLGISDLPFLVWFRLHVTTKLPEALLAWRDIRAQLYLGFKVYIEKPGKMGIMKTLKKKLSIDTPTKTKALPSPSAQEPPSSSTPAPKSILKTEGSG